MAIQHDEPIDREPDVISIEQLAARLDVHPWTVRQAIRRGEIDGVVRIGKRILINREAAERLIAGVPAEAS